MSPFTRHPQQRHANPLHKNPAQIPTPRPTKEPDSTTSATPATSQSNIATPPPPTEPEKADAAPEPNAEDALSAMGRHRISPVPLDTGTHGKVGNVKQNTI